MALRPLSHEGRVARLAVPLHHLFHKMSLPFLAVFSVILIFLHQAYPQSFLQMRARIMEGFAPILLGLSQPLITAEKAVSHIQEMTHLYQDNANLRAEVSRLKGWYAQGLELQAENQRLRAFLNVVPEPALHFHTVRVIANPGGIFTETLLIAAGHQDGLQRGQVVMAENGLVGRIVDVGEHISRILLLTDINSRIPVMLEKNRYPGILGGTNSLQPQLFHMQTDIPIQVGDRIVTSGQGGLFPPGLPIGIIASVSPDKIIVQPFVEFSRLEFVKVVDYNLPGLLEMEPMQGPSFLNVKVR